MWKKTSSSASSNSRSRATSVVEEVDGLPPSYRRVRLSARGPLGASQFQTLLLSLFEVRAADVFHVEENVVVSVLSLDETVTACVVEEINCCLSPLQPRTPPTDNPSEMLWWETERSDRCLAINEYELSWHMRRRLSRLAIDATASRSVLPDTNQMELAVRAQVKF